jgi:hypothetical protein
VQVVEEASCLGPRGLLMISGALFFSPQVGGPMHSGTIDGLYYEVDTWDEGDHIQAQAVISKRPEMTHWCLGEAGAQSIEQAQHLAIWGAYREISKRP